MEGHGQAGEGGWQEPLLKLEFNKSEGKVLRLNGLTLRSDTGWGWLLGKLCRRGSGDLGEEVAYGQSALGWGG